MFRSPRGRGRGLSLTHPVSEGSSSGVDGSKAADDNIVYRTHFKFNAIYVLESLPDGELKTGASLFDDVIHPQKTASLEDVYIRFEQVTSRRKLLTVLSEIRKNARSANHKPIIHIEAHGSDAGIQLADGTIIDWRELALIFAEINEACQCNLTVVAISCKGWLSRARRPHSWIYYARSRAHNP